MSHPLNSTRRLLDRLHARLRRSRSGSVLILVIALLVLMALIGTAFITTAQTDRYSSTVNGYNTQIDLLVQGVVDLSQDLIVNDVVLNNFFRPDNYNHTDGTGLPGALAVAANTNPADAFLASRLPQSINNTVFWPFISASPLTIQIGSNNQFESPRGTDGQFSLRAKAVPDVAQITVNGVTKFFPGLRFIVNGSIVPPPNQEPLLAADTDGDGIADAAFFRLPISQLNGVTYYGAIRILDNGAAINVNIARKPNFVGNPPGTQSDTPFSIPGNFFPANIDLLDLLVGGQNELANLHGYSYTGQVNSPQQMNSYFAPDRNDFIPNGTYEALYSLLGSRLGNPYRNQANKGYFALSLGESTAMASRFCLSSGNAGSSLLEQLLQNSTYAPSTPFAPGQVALWYNTFFNYGPFPAAPNAVQFNPMPLRSLLVARNPVSTFAPSRFPDKGVYGAGPYVFGDRVISNGRAYVCIRDNPPGLAPTADLQNAQQFAAYWAVQPWTTHPTKISVNTGTFGQLWAAYWAVTARAPYTGPNDLNNPVAPTGQATPFWSPIRDRTQQYFLYGSQMRQLRSALAAVNTLALRDPSSNNVPSRTIVVSATAPGAPGPTGKAYAINVFGTKPQPYITEALVHVPEGTANPYVAIELYNPNSVDVSLAPVRLARNSGTQSPPMQLAPIPFAVNQVIPAGGRLVIESDDADRPDDLKPIMQAMIPPPLKAPGLKDVTSLGTQTLMLVRTRAGDGTPGRSDVPWNSYDETDVAGGLNDYVPLDEVDCSGIAAPSDLKAHRYHYARPSPAPGNPVGAWHCTFPYPLSPWNYRGPRAPTAPPFNYNYSGWLTDPEPGGQLQPNPGALNQPKGLYTGNVGNNGTYPGTRPIQIANRDAAGPNSPQFTGTPPRSPFGQFLRNGDILQVTFTGAYTIREIKQNQTLGDLQHNEFVAMNSVTVDNVLAEDGDPNDNQYNNGVLVENIGRFCPIDIPGQADDYSYGPIDANTGLPQIDPVTGRVKPNGAWRYNFALDLFDYLDVRSPQDDYLPNVDPGDRQTLETYNATKGTFSAWAQRYNTDPDPVNNGPGANPINANLGQEDTAGEDGKININTADWRVLSTVPFVTLADGSMDLPTLKQNAALAQAIVYYRDYDDGSGANPPHGHGPFKNIFELQKVAGFKASIHQVVPSDFDPATLDPDDTDGDLSPYNYNPNIPQRDSVIGDFESNFLTLTRISNLITTRSDSFTVYVLVQGWRNAGSATPELVVQRRAAYIADRASVRPIYTNAPGQASTTRTGMTVTNVPTN